MKVIFKCFLVQIFDLHSMTSFNAQFEEVYLTALWFTEHFIRVKKTPAIFSYQGEEVQGDWGDFNFHSGFSADIL